MNSKNILPSAAPTAAVVFMLISSGCVPNVSQPVQAKAPAQSVKQAKDVPQKQQIAMARQAAKPRTANPIIKRTGDWRDWPISAGNWVYRQDGRGSISLFGKPNDEADFMIRCNKANRAIYLSRSGSTSKSGTQMTVRASSGLKSFSAYNSGGQTSYIASQLTPADIFLDKIAFSRGRFVVEIAGHAELVIPIWPEFTRVVEDCRS